MKEAFGPISQTPMAERATVEAGDDPKKVGRHSGQAREEITGLSFLRTDSSSGSL